MTNFISLILVLFIILVGTLASAQAGSCTVLNVDGVCEYRKQVQPGGQTLFVGACNAAEPTCPVGSFSENGVTESHCPTSATPISAALHCVKSILCCELDE